MSSSRPPRSRRNHVTSPSPHSTHLRAVDALRKLDEYERKIAIVEDNMELLTTENEEIRKKYLLREEEFRSLQDLLEEKKIRDAEISKLEVEERNYKQFMDGILVLLKESKEADSSNPTKKLEPSSQSIMDQIKESIQKKLMELASLARENKNKTITIKFLNKQVSELQKKLSVLEPDAKGAVPDSQDLFFGSAKDLTICHQKIKSLEKSAVDSELTIKRISAQVESLQKENLLLHKKVQFTEDQVSQYRLYLNEKEKDLEATQRRLKDVEVGLTMEDKVNLPLSVDPSESATTRHYRFFTGSEWAVLHHYRPDALKAAFLTDVCSACRVPYENLTQVEIHEGPDNSGVSIEISIKHSALLDFEALDYMLLRSEFPEMKALRKGDFEGEASLKNSSSNMNDELSNLKSALNAANTTISFLEEQKRELERTLDHHIQEAEENENAMVEALGEAEKSLKEMLEALHLKEKETLNAINESKKVSDELLKERLMLENAKVKISQLEVECNLLSGKHETVSKELRGAQERLGVYSKNGPTSSCSESELERNLQASKRELELANKALSAARSHIDVLEKEKSARGNGISKLSDLTPRSARSNSALERGGDKNSPLPTDWNNGAAYNCSPLGSARSQDDFEKIVQSQTYKISFSTKVRLDLASVASLALQIKGDSGIISMLLLHDAASALGAGSIPSRIVSYEYIAATRTIQFVGEFVLLGKTVPPEAVNLASEGHIQNIPSRQLKESDMILTYTYLSIRESMIRRLDEQEGKLAELSIKYDRLQTTASAAATDKTEKCDASSLSNASEGKASMGIQQLKDNLVFMSNALVEKENAYEIEVQRNADAEREIKHLSEALESAKASLRTTESEMERLIDLHLHDKEEQLKHEKQYMPPHTSETLSSNNTNEHAISPKKLEKPPMMGSNAARNASPRTPQDMKEVLSFLLTSGPNEESTLRTARAQALCTLLTVKGKLQDWQAEAKANALAWSPKMKRRAQDDISRSAILSISDALHSILLPEESEALTKRLGCHLDSSPQVSGADAFPKTARGTPQFANTPGRTFSRSNSATVFTSRSRSAFSVGQSPMKAVSPSAKAAKSGGITIETPPRIGYMAQRTAPLRRLHSLNTNLAPSDRESGETRKLSQKRLPSPHLQFQKKIGDIGYNFNSAKGSPRNENAFKRSVSNTSLSREKAIATRKGSANDGEAGNPVGKCPIPSSGAAAGASRSNQFSRTPSSGANKSIRMKASSAAS